MKIYNIRKMNVEKIVTDQELDRYTSKGFTVVSEETIDIDPKNMSFYELRQVTSELKTTIENLNGGDVLDLFSFADWNDTSGCTVEKSIQYVRHGTKQTLKQTITTNGTQGRIRRVYPKLDLSEMKDIDYWFYIPDITKIQWISFAWATGASYDARVEIKYYSYYYASDHSKMSLEEGWNHIRIPKEVYEAKTSGITDWNSALNHYIIVMPAADAAEVYWSEVGIDRIRKSYACLCFDDGFAGVYSNIHPWLVEQGVPANLFMPKHRADTNGYLTTAQITEMYNSGIWEICNHSVNEPDDLHLENAETQLAEYTGCRDWIIANGWNRKASAETFATPGAGLCWNTSMLNRLKDAGCKVIRTNRNFIANALPIANHLSISGYSCSYTTSLADVLASAKAAKTGSLFLFYGHNPVPTADSGLEVSVALIKNAISSLKAMGYNFCKLMDWYETSL